MTESLDKIKYIESIIKFDRAVIDRLIEYSHDDNLIVRYRAYCKLNSDNLDIQILSERDWELLPRGVLLNPGDVVWSVYQSGLSYNDSEYTICQFPGNNCDEDIYEKEIDASGYDLWNKEVVHKFVSTHVDRVFAQAAADKKIKEIIIQKEYPYGGYYALNLQVEEISQQDIYDLAKQYDIPDIPKPENSRSIKGIWWNNQDRDESSWIYESQLERYAKDILEILSVDEHYELIDKIYGNLFGRLAYICKENVRESTFFKP
jgi:hypothetical protein